MVTGSWDKPPTADRGLNHTTALRIAATTTHDRAKDDTAAV